MGRIPSLGVKFGNVSSHVSMGEILRCTVSLFSLRYFLTQWTFTHTHTHTCKCVRAHMEDWEGRADDCRWWVQSGKSWLRVRLNPSFLPFFMPCNLLKVVDDYGTVNPIIMIEPTWKPSIKTRPSYNHLLLAEAPGTSWVITLYFCISESLMWN